MRLVTLEIPTSLGAVTRTGALVDATRSSICASPAPCSTPASDGPVTAGWPRPIPGPMREGSVGIGPGIGKDFASSLGPCIATPDEFSVEHSRLEARVDGETWSTGTLANMHFSFPQIIEYITQEATIVPGDLLGSGTIGLGCGFEVDRYLSPGMTVELEADGIGLLRNRIGEKGPRSLIGAPAASR
jgi:hypothetical protein